MASNLDILLFSALYPPHLGGIERFTECLANELALMGCRVTVVTNNTENLSTFEIVNGVSVYRLPCFPALSGRMPFPKPNAEYRKLVKQIASHRYDGVLVNTRFYLHSLLGLRIAKRTSSRAIVLDHGSAHILFGNRLLDPIVAAYEHLITGVIKGYKPLFYGISAKSAEWLRHFDINASGVIGNSIDSLQYVGQASNRAFRQELSLRDSDCLVAFIGRLISAKGILELIEAVETCNRDNVFLAIAGDGPLKERVLETRSSKVAYLGRLNSSDVAKLLCDSNVLCLPSRSEGFCTTLLEASACATASITTDVGGARELIPNSGYGIIIPDANPATISDAICFAADHAEELELMGQNSCLRVRADYSWRSTAVSLLDAFDA